MALHILWTGRKMERFVSFEEISDGRYYGLNDMVKADCNGCKGCFACCQHMEETILLDPLDVYNLELGLSCDFGSILSQAVELKVFEGVILPVLKMVGSEERCGFLNESGRCSIHSFRPGICRLFPLGRIYENGGFSYFLQEKECPYEPKTKVKVKKWIDCPQLQQNQTFIKDWHYFIKGIQEECKKGDMDWIHRMNQELLKSFYFEVYDCNVDFYQQFYERLDKFQKKP